MADLRYDDSMSGVTKQDLVSANETYPNCPRCRVRDNNEHEERNTRPDCTDYVCWNCGQKLRVGNVFSWEGYPEAYELGTKSWPGWSNE